MFENCEPTLVAAQVRVAAMRQAAYTRTSDAQRCVSGLSSYITHGLVTLTDTPSPSDYTA